MYAQIEKEALAITWACDRFHQYLLGLRFHIETDHKPLVPLLSSKNLDDLPLRVQRFRLHLMRYDFSISHVSGKELIIADDLSRAPVKDSKTQTTDLQPHEVEEYVDHIISSLPATEGRLEQIRREQQQDTTCQKLMQYCQQGWPSRDKLPGMFKPYLTVATEFSIKDGLLMRGRRIVVPAVLQKQILDRLHTGHQGITKCRQRARQSVWWLHISAQIEELIRKCPTCCIEQKPRAEPMIPSLLPDRPWHKVGMDLFYWDQATYLLIVDYYSRYIEVSRLSSESAQEVIRHTKSIFARHGIPAEVVSDNGPQFTSEEFQKFSKQYCFSHKTSSPYYPQGNGEAERAVQTVKMLLKKENDAYLALLAYTATPLSCGYSPAQLLMSRQLRSTVPECQENLLPKVPDKVVVTNHDHKMKVQQKVNYDRRHGVRPSQPLHPGNPVWIRDRKETGKVVEMTGSRSYSVQTGQGLYQRNRQHLIHLPEEYSNYSDAGDTDSEPENPSTDAGETLGHSPHSPRRSERNADDQPRRSERNTQKPDRYEPSW